MDIELTEEAPRSRINMYRKVDTLLFLKNVQLIAHKLDALEMTCVSRAKNDLDDPNRSTMTYIGASRERTTRRL